MKDPEYKREGLNILRSKDDKLVGTIDDDGKIIATAPVYYKDAIMAKMIAVAFPDSPSPSTTTPSESPPPTDAGFIKAVWENSQSWEKVADFAREYYKTTPIIKRADEVPKDAPRPCDVFDLKGLPNSEPSLGSRTPAVVEWWIARYPEEARLRYEGTGNETYEEITNPTK